MTQKSFSYIGKPVPRIDAKEKVTGAEMFLDDLRFSGMWHARVVTPDIAHGMLRQIDVPVIDPAEGIIVTQRDIPGVNQIGVVQQDQELLAVTRVRSAAERLAVVAAPTEEYARSLETRVRFVLEPLPVVDSPEHALSPKAPLIHADGNLLAELKVVRGDIDACMAKADLIIDGVYRTGHQEHAYLEPQGAIAVPCAGDRIVVYATCQCPFYIKNAVARVLGIGHNRVRVVQTATGGGFGGKEDYPSEVAACAALVAHRIRHPVRLVYGRDEDFRWSSKRHRTVIHHRLAATSAGKILGMQIESLYDAGPYSGLSVVVAERGNSSACGPYELEAVKVNTKVVYTNNLFGGAFRGFGAPQVTFATERQIDFLANRLSMDPVAIREINLWKEGSITASGERLNGTVPMRETFHKALGISDYRTKRVNATARTDVVRRGIGIATSYYGNNLHKGGERLDRSHAWVAINPDGSVNVAVGLTEMGQGLLTAVAQVVSEELGVELGQVKVDHVDTDRVHDSGPTVASRGTIMAGMPSRIAAKTLKSRILETARQWFSRTNVSIEDGAVLDASSNERLCSWGEMVAHCYTKRIEMIASGFYKPPEKPYDHETGQGMPYAVNSYSTHVAEVEIDVLSGLVSVKRVIAVHDIGRVINKQGVAGQIEGGIAQGAGMALWEELKTKDGILFNAGFTDYAVPGIGETPKIEWALVENPWDGGPFGAKGIGEPSLIGVPAAIANAVSDALGKPVYELPLTPERVLTLFDVGGG
jgi:CO/xanthine dehydrogenase Mo-binding subunit